MSSGMIHININIFGGKNRAYEWVILENIHTSLTKEIGW